MVSSKLFYIYTSKYYYISVVLKNKSLFYKISNNSEEMNNEESNKHNYIDAETDFNNPNNNYFYITDLELEEWNFVVFSHKPSSFLQKAEFYVRVNDNLIMRNIDYPNIMSHKLIDIGFASNFTGQISSIIMTSLPITEPIIT
jgi:hypothetical protein